MQQAADRVFVYHLTQASLLFPHVKWGLDEFTFMNTIGALILFFFIYDFGYATFHWILHWPSFYRLVHMHHHRQISPTRGNYDAINVHPFEFLVGEYNHLFVVWLVPCHAATISSFLDLRWSTSIIKSHAPGPPDPGLLRRAEPRRAPPLAAVELRLGHTMVWDRAFGWYRDYAPLHLPSSRRPAAEAARPF